MFSRVIAFMLIGISATVVSAEDKPLSDVKMIKVGMGTTKQDFLKLYPKATAVRHADGVYGVKAYVVEEDNTGHTSFEFLDEKLHVMTTIWNKKGMKRNLEWVPIVEDFAKKFGKPDKTLEAGTYMWANSKCRVLTDVQEDRLAMWWVSEEREAELKALKRGEKSKK